MEQAEEMKKTFKEREQEREEKINKIERQLSKIYDRLLSIDIEVKEKERQIRLKDIKRESEKLNAEKSYLENESNSRYDTIQDNMNWFNEK